MFGWISKLKPSAAENLRQAAENLRQDALRQVCASEVARVKEGDAARERYESLKELHLQTRAELEASNTERRLLLDRIVQLSGQPALFERQGTGIRDQASVSKPEEPKPANTLPGPAARVGFDEVHQAARTALKDGTFSLKGRSN